MPFAAIADLAESVQRNVVGVRKGVKIPLRGRDVGVPKPLLHDRQVRAAREEPRGVSMTQVVGPDADPEVRCCEGSQPNVIAEPPAGDAPIRVDGPRSPGRVLSAGPTLRPVDGKRFFAVAAPALARRVSGERAMQVPSASVIRLGQPKLRRARYDLESRCGLTDTRYGEIQII